MTYTVRLHPKVDKFLKKCEAQLQERIRNKFQLLKEEPFRYLEHYEGDDCHKLRIGDYRALVDVDQKNKIVFIRVLDHRRRIYKRN
ncbi:MAG: type II toxin-antitoxin system RelE/ParE family toxin [Candidatus Diapherotrites archaeon]|nr:type II toxin-antitoxin system RelE/ParE family toxin [Candidatus Diapherotrites archaeon]